MTSYKIGQLVKITGNHNEDSGYDFHYFNVGSIVEIIYAEPDHDGDLRVIGRKALENIRWSCKKSGAIRDGDRNVLQYINPKHMIPYNICEKLDLI
jgi:hypothetical protein